MAGWTILGKGIESDTKDKSFGITLYIDTKTWAVGGPDAAKFFHTTKGSFGFAALPELGLQLLRPGPEEVAFFRNLTASSPVGSRGTGRASEKGINFHWTLDSH